MKYETYAYLRALVEEKEEQLHKDYLKAIVFIPPEKFKRGQTSSLEKANEILSKEYARLRKVKEELHASARAAYRNHPNPKMRKFWGFKI